MEENRGSIRQTVQWASTGRLQAEQSAMYKADYRELRVKARKLESWKTDAVFQWKNNGGLEEDAIGRDGEK